MPSIVLVQVRYLSQLNRTLQHEAIYIEMMAAVGLFYDAIFKCPTGKGGVITSRIEELVPTGLANGLPKTSILTPNYNRMIERLLSFGLKQHISETNNDTIVERIRAKVAKSGYKVGIEPPPIIAPLNMYDVQGLFYVLLLMLVISIIAFIGELLKKGNGKKAANRDKMCSHQKIKSGYRYV